MTVEPLRPMDETRTGKEETMMRLAGLMTAFVLVATLGGLEAGAQEVLPAPPAPFKVGYKLLTIDYCCPCNLLQLQVLQQLGQFGSLQHSEQCFSDGARVQRL